MFNKTIQNEKYILNVFNDGQELNPRDLKTLGTIIIFNKQYELGDKLEDMDSSWEELELRIKYDYNSKLILPVYSYSPSSVAISLTDEVIKLYPIHVGFIYTTKEKIMAFYQTENISEELISKAYNKLCFEIQHYNDFLTGYAFSYTITDKTSNKQVVPKSQFYGDYINPLVRNYFSNEELKEISYTLTPGGVI